jgi:hypothetical protein
MNGRWRWGMVEKSPIGSYLSLPPCLYVHEQAGFLQATFEEADEMEVSMYSKSVCSVDAWRA